MSSLVPNLPAARHMVPVAGTFARLRVPSSPVVILIPRGGSARRPSADELVILGDPDAPKPQGVVHAGKKPKAVALVPAPFIKPVTGRNDPCPCGSGKKTKKCHRK